MPSSSESSTSPLDLLPLLAVQEVEVGPDLRHVEAYTTEGLLTLLWHGPLDAEQVVITGGGGMGSLLGPADGLYHDLGAAFAREGIATIRVGWRRPNHLDPCVLDLAVAADLAGQHGGRRFVVVGHSFGGAVAVNVALALGGPVVGVVTLATQSAGCEGAAGLAGRPFLLLHGDRDEILPAQTSEIVRGLAGGGEVVVLSGAGHLMSEAGTELRERLTAWIPAVLAGTAPPPPAAAP